VSSVASWIWDYAGTVPGTGESELCDIAVFDAADIWVTGNQSSYRRPLAAHWDGERWYRYPVPGTGSLQRLTGSATDDLWAVSWNMRDDSVFHWDGSAWSPTSLAPVEGDLDLHDVLSFGPDDVWLAGAAVRPRRGGILALPVLQHWDGRGWSHATLPVLDTEFGAFFALGGRAEGDLWAVGVTGSMPDAIEARPCYLRFDGRSWRDVLNGAALPVIAESIVVTTGEDVVFAGRDRVETAKRMRPIGWPACLRWTGTGWDTLDPPPLGSALGYGVASDGEGGLWLTGTGERGEVVFLRWTGGQWCQAALGPGMARRRGSVHRMAVVPGTAEIWGVGHTIAGRVSGLVVRYGPAA
jgi:hypothetical protein